MEADVSLIELLEGLPDPRHARGKRHPLPALLALAVVAMLAGMTSYEAIVDYGQGRGWEFLRLLGFTRRRAASWLTAEEITAALRRYDPHDPAGYDFSLCHMGMLQRCPSRRDAKRCEGCGVKPVCIHWRAAQSGRVQKPEI